VSTRRVVLIAIVVVGACFGLAAAASSGSWRDLWLNLLAEAFGAAFIVLFVDVLFERSKAHERDERRRLALQELGAILQGLHEWLTRLSGAAPEPLEAMPQTLATTDFAARGTLGRDRYIIEGVRRTFEQTTVDIARWEWNFVDTADLFGDDFRRRAENLRMFVSEIGSFLEGMERYIQREQPTSPVFAFDGITE
jgi:hypothetical protein